MEEYKKKRTEEIIKLIKENYPDDIIAERVGVVRGAVRYHRKKLFPDRVVKRSRNVDWEDTVNDKSNKR